MRNAIGIDIGGTKIAMGLVQENGILLKKEEFTTLRKEKGEKILRMITDRIPSFYDENTTGIGIGSAGQIGHSGKVLSATDTFSDWQGLPIQTWLENETGYRVAVVNDVQAMGLGEQYFGAGRDVKNFLCVAIGTGIGGAIIADGQLLRGHAGAAGEVGHMVLYPNGRECPCGNKGCFEAYASGTALEAMYAENFKEVKKGQEIFAEALGDNENAAFIINQYIENLAIGMTSLTNIFNPEKIILGGGVSGSLVPFITDIRKQVRNQVNKINKDVEIELSMLGGDAMIIGAASLVF
ncbi:ROK family protein [Oceanobacillus sp. M60]|uniref:ROK family protein n=1 Tax=Oceanobacillus oncorhynchi TaxID=545501 RepID=UPI002116611A|nr:ROK family protein [Oceanobacillus oncorhynchi]UUI39231.1 ROK family protein [Oceanobacillus oncorhynchi]